MTAQERNVGLMLRMGDFLQAVAGLPAAADGTRFLPTGSLENARELSSDAYFAGEATPEARLVTRMGAFIDKLDALPLTRSGMQAVSPELAAEGRSLADAARTMAS